MQGLACIGPGNRVKFYASNRGASSQAAARSFGRMLNLPFDARRIFARQDGEITWRVVLCRCGTGRRQRPCPSPSANRSPRPVIADAGGHQFSCIRSLCGPRYGSFRRFHGKSLSYRQRVTASCRVTQPISRPRPFAFCHIGGVCKATPVDRQTATADALGKPGLQALQLGYPLVDALCPLARQPRPIPTRRHAIAR
jgi:hypothetical protein